MPHFKIAFPVALLALCLSPPTLSAADEADVASTMSEAATHFLGSLDGSQRLKIQYNFDSPERLNWHFIPRDRNGLGMWDLTGAARNAADTLVKSGLSLAGYEKTLEVRSLEEVLYLFEVGDEAERRLKRHPHKYFLTIFGTPGEKGEWGWRFEGHHLSLNYTIRDGVIVSTTPEFFGANPGLIDAGPGRSLRVLGRREELARAILHACDKQQLARMVISEKPPGEVRGAGESTPVVSEAVGLAYSEMSPEQQGLLKELIGVYVAAMPAAVVRDRMLAIEISGLDTIRIAWWGGPDVNQPHHYVVQGKSFIIEYNNTQNSANHVHAMWRNVDGDFGQVIN
jgi:Protein of unknown function (DUF3500)